MKFIQQHKTDLPKRQDVWFADVPAAAGIGIQQKPVVILKYKGMQYQVAVVQMHETCSVDEVPVTNVEYTGLGRGAVIRTTPILTIEQRAFRSKMGQLDRADWDALLRKVRV